MSPEPWGKNYWLLEDHSLNNQIYQHVPEVNEMIEVGLRYIKQVN
jgi:hypothetical protein